MNFPKCDMCQGPLNGPVIEMHEICGKRCLALFQIMKQLASQGQQAFERDADELWPDVNALVFGRTNERIYRVVKASDNSSTMEDITDLWYQTTNFVRQVMQDEGEDSEEESEDEDENSNVNEGKKK